MTTKITSYNIDTTTITSVGTLSSVTITGNITSGNANLGNLTTSNYYAGNASLLHHLTGSNVTGQVANAIVSGTVYTNAQPNITSVGTLSSLTVSGQTNLGAAGNIIISGGSSGYVLSTNGAGNVSWQPQSGGSGGAASMFGNVAVDTFSGDGTTTSFTLSKAPEGVNQVIVNYNGTSVLRTSFSIVGTTLTFGSAPANGSSIEVTTFGLADTSGNVALTGANVFLGTVSNLHITGGTSNQYLKTDGNGNLSFATVTAGLSNARAYGFGLVFGI